MMGSEIVYAFIDDSINPDAMACAALVVKASARAATEEAISLAKREVGVDANVPIHSRVMFGGHARERSPWAGVDPARIATMLENLCEPALHHLLQTERSSGLAKSGST